MAVRLNQLDTSSFTLWVWKRTLISVVMVWILHVAFALLATTVCGTEDNFLIAQLHWVKFDVIQLIFPSLIDEGEKMLGKTLG